MREFNPKNRNIGITNIALFSVIEIVLLLCHYFCQQRFAHMVGLLSMHHHDFCSILRFSYWWMICKYFCKRLLSLEACFGANLFLNLNFYIFPQKKKNCLYFLFSFILSSYISLRPYNYIWMAKIENYLKVM